MATEMSIHDLGQSQHVTDDEIAEVFGELGTKDPNAEVTKIPGADDQGGPSGDDQGTQDNQGAGTGDDDLDEDDDRSARQSAEELAAATPEEREAARERDRTRRQNQRQRQRTKIESLERQLANTLATNQELSARVHAIENSNQSSQLVQFQSAERDAAQAIDGLKQIIADATAKGDGVRAAEATEAMARVIREQERLTISRQQFEQQLTAPRQRSTSTPNTTMDPETMSQAQAFLKRNSWYKGPNAPDRDSKIMALLDRELFNEGWNPASPTYWTELENRAKSHIAHRFNGSQEQEGRQMTTNNNGQGHNAGQGQRRPKSPIAGGGNINSNGGKNSRENYDIGRDRVQALKDSGIWDNEAARKRVIAQWQKDDAEAARNS